MLEINFLNKPINLYEILFEIQISGYKIIIAHPERNLFLFENNKKDILKLKKIGCKFQLNLPSICNSYGEKVRKNSEYLINNDFYDYTGSDIHKISDFKIFEKKIKVRGLNKIEKLLQNNSEFE